jgi:hypothetical protein
LTKAPVLGQGRTRVHFNSDGHTREGDTPLWGTAHAAGTPAEEGGVHKRRRVRSCTGPEGSREGRGTGPRSGRAAVGSHPWAVRGAEANDSLLPSGHRSTHAVGAGCAHGTRPDNHPGEGYIHAAGRAGYSRPRGAGKHDGGSASGFGLLWELQAASARRLADRAGRVGGGSYVCNAGHTGVLKVAAIQLLDGCSEIGSSLKLDKTIMSQRLWPT